MPEDVVNEALDELGVAPIGDMFAMAEPARRVYDSVLRGLHATFPWNFCRRQRQVDLRGDVNGTYNSNRFVPLPWTYMYEWPNDCVQVRNVLGIGASAVDESGAPLGLSPLWDRPARFVVTSVPLVNDVASDWSIVEGHSPEETRVILTDELGAIIIYTGIVQYPDAWPPLFRRALVAELAARLALSSVTDKALARTLRADQRQIAHASLLEAQAHDANEGWNVFSHTPDWIRARESDQPFDEGIY
jgi:hypothetical protein